VTIYQIVLLAEKANSMILAKRKRTIFLTMFALFLSSVLFAPPLSPPLLPPLVEGAAAQTPPKDCSKCIVIEYEDGDTVVISGVESFANTTTLHEQYNSYLWKFVNSLVSDGFELNAVMMDDSRYEDDDDDSIEHVYHVLLGMP
jgi:hypothetical protein